MCRLTLLLSLLISIPLAPTGFFHPLPTRLVIMPLASIPGDADALIERAKALRDEAAALESTRPPVATPSSEDLKGDQFRPKLSYHVYGANGLLGSHVCRELLRQKTSTPVTAYIHDYARYSKLSLTVGAEDGQGMIQPAWQSLEQTMEYTPAMRDYGLSKLSIQEAELLAPPLPRLAEGSQVFYLASDFRGSIPRSIANLDVGLLFRAFSRPLKGRVDIEGLRNVIDAQPESIVYASICEEYGGSDFVTPLGDFKALKREGERVLRQSGMPCTIVRLPKVDTLRESPGELKVVKQAEVRGRKRARWISTEDAARCVKEAGEGGEGVWEIVVL